MKITVNQKMIEINESVLDKSLLLFLREDLDLTGTKNGCGKGYCGACVVLVDQEPIRACRKMVREIIGKSILTIEGLASPEGSLHPLQQAFMDEGAIQCGFCTPGMVLTAHAFLLRNKKPTREQIRRAVNGNLCRCTGYQQIVNAVELASRYY